MRPVGPGVCGRCVLHGRPERLYRSREGVGLARPDLAIWDPPASVLHLAPQLGVSDRDPASMARRPRARLVVRSRRQPVQLQRIRWLPLTARSTRTGSPTSARVAARRRTAAARPWRAVAAREFALQDHELAACAALVIGPYEPRRIVPGDARISASSAVSAVAIAASYGRHREVYA